MKGGFFIALALVFSTFCAMAQDYKREGNTFVSTKATTSGSKEVKTSFTWKDSKGMTYPIYVGATGACYIKRVSAKSGNEYKQYLGAEISMQICKELGIEYKGKKQE